MSSSAVIKQLLLEHKIDLVGDVISDVADSNKFFAFIKIKSDQAGNHEPSLSALSKISHQLSEQYGVDVSFVPTEDGHDKLAESIKLYLFRNYPSFIEKVSVTFPSGKVAVWIEAKHFPSRTEYKNLTEKTRAFVQLLGADIDNINVVPLKGALTPTACLKAIRLLSPVDMKSLAESLREKKINIPDEKSLNRLLDALRRDGFIIRRKDGAYALTWNGVNILGTSKNSRSPDISRALDIARRRT